MRKAAHDWRVTALLLLIAGHLVFAYPFMQLRVPPSGFGIPLGELLLAAVLLTTDVALVLYRMGRTVVLLPFIVWWAWGFSRLVVDASETGFWAFRDSTQLVESLFLIVGFTLAGDEAAVPRVARWARAIIVISCLYGLLFVFADPITAWSPTLPGASEQPIPIFGTFATTGALLLWGAFYCMTRPAKTASERILYGLTAGGLVAFTMVVVQARTTYLQLAAMAVLLWLVRPRNLMRMGAAVPVLLLLLVVISAFELRVAGRLTSDVSIDFFVDHIQAMVGIGHGNGGVAEAAEGVSLRMGWWNRLYDLLTRDMVTLLTGLGYGIPLTDFRDQLGTLAREPHNSLISVAARLGLIGLVGWVWMQAELFRASFIAYRDCRRRGLQKSADFVLLVIAFAVITLASCFGEDTMEKPYNAIPYYAFWGIALRIAYRVRSEAAGWTRPRIGLQALPHGRSQG
jgi:hypothetical protein